MLASVAHNLNGAERLTSPVFTCLGNIYSGILGIKHLIVPMATSGQALYCPHFTNMEPSLCTLH